MLINLKHALDNVQIESILRNDPFCKKYFIGVFARDRLPQYVMQRPAVLVLNFDRATEPGSHWCVIALDKDSYHSIYYFESYGLCPIFPELRVFFNRNGKRLCTSRIRLQADNSLVCGTYACTFAIMFCKYKSLRPFFQLFQLGHNYNENDKKVLCIFYRYWVSTQKHATLGFDHRTVGLSPIQGCKSRATWKKTKLGFAQGPSLDKIQRCVDTPLPLI